MLNYSNYNQMHNLNSKMFETKQITTKCVFGMSQIN